MDTIMHKNEYDLQPTEARCLTHTIFFASASSSPATGYWSQRYSHLVKSSHFRV
jgi:peroxiredoxin